jgi:tripartite ATP-independent transporter DctP family solute receptor
MEVKMKKIVLLVLVFALVITGAFAAGGQSSSGAQQKKVVVQLGLENHPGEPVTDGVYEWSRLAAEKSNGSLEIQVFPSSQLGSKNEIIDQMLAGMGVITLADGAFFGDRGAPDMGITMGPYFFANWDEAWHMVESNWWKDQSKILEGRGLKILASNFIYGDRHTLTTRPIRTVEDFRGLKLRVPNNLMQIKGTEVMGATPTPMPLGDVYTALQQGVIDGVENPLPVLYGGKFHEVAKFLTLDGHIKLITIWFCGTQFFNTLSKEHQDVLIESGRQAGLYNNDLAIKAAEDAIALFKNEGVEIINIDMARFQAQAQPFYTNPDVIKDWSPGLLETTNSAKR